MGRLGKSDLTPEIRKLLELPGKNNRRFSKDQVRGYAIRCLAPLARLTKVQRERVLQQAHRINEV